MKMVENSSPYPARRETIKIAVASAIGGGLAGLMGSVFALNPLLTGLLAASITVITWRIIELLWR